MKPKSHEVVSSAAPAGVAIGHAFPQIGTEEWGLMNRRRAELIRKDIQGTLSDEERQEYETLQRLSLMALETVRRSP